MSCCIYPSHQAAETPQTAASAAKKERDLKITAFVLGLLALLLSAASFALFGFGTLSPTWMGGLGMFPYLGGAVLGFIAVGLVIGMGVTFAISSVKQVQQERVH
jgi:hypothetical protein